MLFFLNIRIPKYYNLSIRNSNFRELNQFFHFYPLDFIKKFTKNKYFLIRLRHSKLYSINLLAFLNHVTFYKQKIILYLNF